MIVATLRVVVPARKRGEIHHALLSVLGPTEVQAGCMSCHLYQEAERPNAFTLVQEWATQTDLDRYIRSDLYQKVLAVMESASERPELRFDTVTHTAGIEAVQAARAGKVER